MVLRSLSTALALAAPFLYGPIAAQSLVTFDASGSTVIEFTGPRRQVWNGPSERVLEYWPTAAQFPCPPPLAFGPPPALLGDVAVDASADTIWVTDGITVAEFNRFGELLRSFSQTIFASPLLGLGMDSELGELWMTDGFEAARVQPPAGPCGGIETVTVPPFTLFSTSPPNPTTDLEWDPATSTLWVCDTLGNVGNINVDGSLGPAGGFVATGLCNLVPPLQGIAVDVTRTPSRLFVTDGVRVAFLEHNGTDADPTWAISRTCQLGTGNMLGLAFANRPLQYGRGVSPFGPAPQIGSTGQPYLGSSTFTVDLEGAAPSGLAGLYQSLEPLCPVGTWELLAIPRLGCPYSSFGNFPVDMDGRVSVPQPVSPTLAAGETTHYHWVVLAPSLEFEWSNRLRVTLGEF